MDHYYLVPYLDPEREFAFLQRRPSVPRPASVPFVRNSVSAPESFFHLHRAGIRQKLEFLEQGDE